ncbi:hypothetical protein BY458DRAFT_132140 [Sporodiniella umbellata]|nr:hypothetical protein BY458DRAFT_132140 [Sporodiniella umbellata]
MENNTSEADQIRLKRLAKLQQVEKRESGSTNAPSSGTHKQALPVLEESVHIKKPIPKRTSTVSTTKIESPVKPSVTADNTTRVKPAKSFEDWQNDVLSRILQVTLNPESVYHQGKCVYLKDLVNELIEEGGKRRSLKGVS